MTDNTAITLRSFNSVRSYYFRLAVYTIDREDREYGPPYHLPHFRLADFRALWDIATAQTKRWQSQSQRLAKPIPEARMTPDPTEHNASINESAASVAAHALRVANAMEVYANSKNPLSRNVALSSTFVNMQRLNETWDHLTKTIQETQIDLANTVERNSNP